MTSEEAKLGRIMVKGCQRREDGRGEPKRVEGRQMVDGLTPTPRVLGVSGGYFSEGPRPE